MLYAHTGHQWELLNHYGLIYRFPYFKKSTKILFNTHTSGINQLYKHSRDFRSGMGGEYHLPHNFFHTQYKETEAWKCQKRMIYKPENTVQQTLHLLKMRLPICNYLSFMLQPSRDQWWDGCFSLMQYRWEVSSNLVKVNIQRGQKTIQSYLYTFQARPMIPSKAAPWACEHLSVWYIYSKTLICLVLFTPTFWKYSIFSPSMIWKYYCTNRTSELKWKTVSPLKPWLEL